MFETISQIPSCMHQHVVVLVCALESICYFSKIDFVQEFYHPQLQSGSSDLPRIFGMTASPIKSKGI